MTAPAAAEAEIRALVAEAVGALRLISEAAGPLRRARVEQMIAEAHRALVTAGDLARRLP